MLYFNVLITTELVDYAVLSDVGLMTRMSTGCWCWQLDAEMSVVLILCVDVFCQCLVVINGKHTLLWVLHCALGMFLIVCSLSFCSILRWRWQPALHHAPMLRPLHT